MSQATLIPTASWVETTRCSWADAVSLFAPVDRSAWNLELGSADDVFRFTELSHLLPNDKYLSILFSCV